MVPSFPCESGHSYNVRKTEHRPTNSVKNGPGNNTSVLGWKWKLSKGSDRVVVPGQEAEVMARLRTAMYSGVAT